MKIAIIESDEKFAELLRRKVLEENWFLEFFSSTSAFGQVNLNDYDVIVCSEELPSMSGKSLIKTISKKTSAELVIMGNSFNLTEDEIFDENITGFVNKNNPDELIEKLRYLESKTRIFQFIENENEIAFDMNNAVGKENAFDIELRKDVMILSIHSMLDDDEKDYVVTKFDKKKMTKCIICFSSIRVTSVILGLLAFFYKALRFRKGKLVFWNKLKSPTLMTQIQDCRLDKIIPVFDSLKDAMESFD